MVVSRGDLVKVRGVWELVSRVAQGSDRIALDGDGVCRLADVQEVLPGRRSRSLLAPPCGGGWHVEALPSLDELEASL